MQPPFLQPGDTIGLVATARKVSLDEMQPAIDIFKSWGLKVKLSDTFFNINHQLAGTDEERAAGLQQMLDDPEIKAIVCARGGYGTIRIIDKLKWEKFAQNPKWLVGYSDITVLHSHINTHLKLPSLQGTMPISMAATDSETLEANEALYRALFGKELSYSLPRHELNRHGNAKGTLMGGNLSVLYSLMGSATQPPTEGKILFLEDLDEYLYHIDRMMMCLKRAGMLSNLSALVVGGMSEMKDNAIPFGKTAEDIIWDAVKEYSYPVYFNFPAGHIKRNCALPFGAKAEILNNELAFTGWPHRRG